MAYIPITNSQVDAKSPVDDILMQTIQGNLDWLYNIASQGGFPITWELMGSLYQLKNNRNALGIAPANNVFTPKTARFTLKKSGVSGSMVFDLRKITSPASLIPITGIAHQFDGLTQSIANVAPALATQSITRAVAQISTQSITFAKASLSVANIVQALGTNKWRYNFTASPDADFIVGRSMLFAGCTSGVNNGTFVIAEVGTNYVVVTNASGVAQTAAAGTGQLRLMSYNHTNPVSAQYVPGEFALFAAHTSGVNNGSFEVYKINQSGNNIWVWNTAGVVQAATPGTCDVNRFIFAFTVAADTTDFQVGEKAKTASHTTGANNGNFPIVAVNSGGNNLWLYNAAGVVQGAAAGNVNTNRWIYALSTDPAGQITAGDNLQLENHTNALNSGIFVCKQVKRSGTNNVIIYNEAGVAQASTPGNVRTTKKIVSFGSDVSAQLSVGRFVELENTSSPLYNQDIYRAPFTILEANRGGGANYNLVIDSPAIAPLQVGALGFVANYQDSVCNTKPTVPAVPVSIYGATAQVYEFTDFINAAVPQGTMLGLFLVNHTMVGDIQDLTLQLQ